LRRHQSTSPRSGAYTRCPLIRGRINFELARELLTELKELGVRLALDDFGTGHSSLRHLQMLSFDKIKIDRSFVHNMNGSLENGKIVAAVVGLGHSLGLPTVAEGVEDAATAAALRDMGCDIGQGWLFGRPLPEAEAGALARGGVAGLPLQVFSA
jgi:EAL domain-containing protein (putative c-di-GMP-specific phosphodiesterase class I)